MGIESEFGKTPKQETPESQDDRLDNPEVNAAAQSLLESYTQNTKKNESNISTDIGEDAGSLNVWDWIRESESKNVKKELQKQLGQNMDSNPFRSAIAQDIDEDVFGPKTGPWMKAPDATDSVPERRLLEHISQNNGVLGEKELEDASSALKLALLNREYKLFKWQSAVEVGKTIDAIEELTEKNISFNPDNAGLPGWLGATEFMLAEINVDLKSKPNFQYSNPAHMNLRKFCRRTLEQISRINAKQQLKG